MPKSMDSYLYLFRKDLKNLIGGYFLAQFRIMFVVAAILAVGFIILGVRYGVLLAILIAVLDFLPLFGTGTALFPWALVKLLSGLLGGEMPVQKKDRLSQITCPTCGTSYEEFVNNSCFGCGDCYTIFDLLIQDNIKQLQGSNAHKGKVPRYHYSEEGAAFSVEDMTKQAQAVPGGELDVEEQIQVLETQLHEAVIREEYEIAAQCRDKIKELREEIRKC